MKDSPMTDLKQLLRSAFNAGAHYQAEMYGSSTGEDFETWFALYQAEHDEEEPYTGFYRDAH